jgi:hypothetical protein
MGIHSNPTATGDNRRTARQSHVTQSMDTRRDLLPCSCQPQQQSRGLLAWALGAAAAAGAAANSRCCLLLLLLLCCCCLLFLSSVSLHLLSWTTQPSTAVSLSSVRARLFSAA